VGAGAVAEVDQLIDDCLDPQPFGQRGGQQQPGVGDRVVVVEHRNKPCRAVGGGIEKLPSSSGSMDVSATPFSLLRGPFS
jgi:hypothetical protein